MCLNSQSHHRCNHNGYIRQLYLEIKKIKILKIYDLSHKAAYGCFNPRGRLSTSCLCRHFSHPVGRPMGRNKPASARQATSSDPCMPARTPQCRRGDTRSRLAPTPCGTRPFFDFDVTPEQLVSIHAPAWGATVYIFCPDISKGKASFALSP